jgi:diguanylate cyclase (GGDEF)-like protein
MEASLVTRRVLARADVRGWAWWQLPWLLKCYVGLVPTVAAALTCLAAVDTTWHAADLWKFALLLGCGLISVAATPRVVYRQGGMTRDFITVWVLPIAILLPPVYAMVTPIPLYVLTQMWVFRGVVYRRVFTVGAIGLSYGAASVLFRAFPASFAGGTIGTGMHALTWAVAVAIAEQVGRRGHQLLIMGGIKLSNPSAKLAPQELNREALVADFAEFDLGVLITIVVAVSPVLAIFAVPTVLLVRRFMMHGQLLAQSRIDTKTGLLNSATWERVTDALQSQLRAYDVAGRFGGEEFVILLPHAREVDALAVAERLRVHIADLAIPVDDSDASGPFVRVTISVGVAALDGVSRELTDMLNAADAALYHAKETGRNKTHVVTANAPAS